MLIQNGDRIVFTGDSVTDAGRGRPVGEGLHAGVGDGYVRQIETILNVLYPDWTIWISNTGSSGDTSRSLKARWQNDVMNLHPDWVSLMIGVNDVWRQFDSPGVLSSHVYPDEYLQYRHSSYISWDRVHPGHIGSLLIAREFIKAIGVDRSLL